MLNAMSALASDPRSIVPRVCSASISTVKRLALSNIYLPATASLESFATCGGIKLARLAFEDRDAPEGRPASRNLCEVKHGDNARERV
jgi:hypothetical protein